MKFKNIQKFYIDGQWLEPMGTETKEVLSPVTEDVTASIILGNKEDVNRAVEAAKDAFINYSQTSRLERLDLLKRIQSVYERRMDEMADVLMFEMGLPRSVAKEVQAVLPLQHIKIAIDKLNDYPFEDDSGITRISKEPIGVCALITPWNWPPTSISVKVIPALAMGCTVILKPSEYSPFSALLWTEIMDEAGVPHGVFNMIMGEGPIVGNALSTHNDVSMVSITGSTRAGIQVAKDAAPTVKRVHQELGGKSPNIILENADFTVSVPAGIQGLMFNSGQSCSAPSRMLVPKSKMEEVIKIAGDALKAISVGRPEEDKTIGPVMNMDQYQKIQSLIEKGIEEGATLVGGGIGRPERLQKGYFVKPTIFANVTNDMTIAKEEIFGPVLVIIGYNDKEDAIKIANDTLYGLAGYVQGNSLDEVKEVAKRIQAGQIYLNGSGTDVIDFSAPFGGYKHSGNGREWGETAFESYLEIKSLVGFTPATV